MESAKRVKMNIWEYNLLKSTNEIKVEFICNLNSHDFANNVIESDTYPITGPDCFRIKLSPAKRQNISMYAYGICLHYLLKKKSNITDMDRCTGNNKMVHICVHAMTDNLFFNVGCSAEELSIKDCQSWSLINTNNLLSAYNYCYNIQKIKVTFELKRSQNIENVDNSGTFFSNMHENSTLTDFKLTGEDGSSVDVHRILLAIRSPVMSRMLSGDWKESKENSLKISGSNASTLAQFKRYLYLKEVPEDNLEFLMELACLYEIEDMKAATAEKLCSQLSVERAPQVLAFARRLKLDTLVESISNYILDNSHDLAAAVIKDSVVNVKYGEKPLGNDLISADQLRLDITASNLALQKIEKTLKKKLRKHK